MPHTTFVVFLMMLMHGASLKETTHPASLTNISTVQVTLKIVDINGVVVERNSLPFGTNIKLKIEYASRDKTLAGVPVNCYLTSAVSKRKYAILKNGCGDGIVMSNTDGFTIQNGSGFSSIFRALDFSNDNKIKFSCNYTLIKTADVIKSCNRSSAILKTTTELEHSDEKGNNPGMFNIVETRVMDLAFPQQSGSKLKRGNVAPSKNGTSPSAAENHISLHGRRLLFILSILGLYMFILAVFISIQIDRNKLESMRRSNPVL